MAAAASVLRRQERRQEVREKKFFFTINVLQLNVSELICKKNNKIL